MSDLDDIARRISKDIRENKFNTRRVSKNLPYIERKLDIVASDYPYTVNFPAKVGSSSAFLNLYFKPDNCCDCFRGGSAYQRDAIADIAGWDGYVPYEGEAPPVGDPIEGEYSGPLSDGTEYTAILTNFHSTSNTPSPYWGGESYPWFYPIATDNFEWENNQYGDMYLSTAGIGVPIRGFYLIYVTVNFSGVTTNTSKITLSLKEYNSELDQWEVITKRIYSIQAGNICWGVSENTVCASYNYNGSFNITGDFYAICAPITGSSITAFIKAEDVLYFTPGTGQLQAQLMAVGSGALKGQIVDRDTGVPIEGATVTVGAGTRDQGTTDENGMYYIYDVRAGNHQVRVEATDYTTITVITQIIFNTVTTLDVGLPHI